MFRDSEEKKWDTCNAAFLTLSETYAYLTNDKRSIELTTVLEGYHFTTRSTTAYSFIIHALNDYVFSERA